MKIERRNETFITKYVSQLVSGDVFLRNIEGSPILVVSDNDGMDTYVDLKEGCTIANIGLSETVFVCDAKLSFAIKCAM